jgi:hypothetical protein
MSSMGKVVIENGKSSQAGFSRKKLVGRHQDREAYVARSDADSRRVGTVPGLIDGYADAVCHKPFNLPQLLTTREQVTGSPPLPPEDPAGSAFPLSSFPQVPSKAPLGKENVIDECLS